MNPLAPDVLSEVEVVGRTGAAIAVTSPDETTVASAKATIARFKNMLLLTLLQTRFSD